MKRKVVIKELDNLISEMKRYYDEYCEENESSISHALVVMSRMIQCANCKRDRFRTRIEIERDLDP
jgi:flavorubredoxin